MHRPTRTVRPALPRRVARIGSPKSEVSLSPAGWNGPPFRRFCHVQRSEGRGEPPDRCVVDSLPHVYPLRHFPVLFAITVSALAFICSKAVELLTEQAESEVVKFEKKESAG